MAAHEFKRDPRGHGPAVRGPLPAHTAQTRRQSTTRNSAGRRYSSRAGWPSWSGVVRGARMDCELAGGWNAPAGASSRVGSELPSSDDPKILIEAIRRQLMA